MICSKCSVEIQPGDERNHFNSIMCEDCYIMVLSPVKTCDPWAVHSAKMLEKNTRKTSELTPNQKNILEILKEHESIEYSVLMEEFRSGISMDEFEREFAPLSHMNKIKAEKVDKKVIIRLNERENDVS